MKRKKTHYALKTPRVVALPFIYDVEYIIISNQKRENYDSVSIVIFMCLFQLWLYIMRWRLAPKKRGECHPSLEMWSLSGDEISFIKITVCVSLSHCEASSTAGIFIAVQSIYPSSSIRPKTPLKHFLTSWPWPLTYDLDLWTWPRYPSTWPTHQKSGPYVCPFSRESGNTHTHTDTHTHRRCQNYYTLSLTRGVKKAEKSA